ncbi:MFS transporter [uncultured Jatrophihabitans sp.]|uniref:MFS transporter n=1 Tax=uncultured Jatrophihabitans sp. TaxID=1610747 RepID=UPI0035C9BDE9
MTRAAAPSAHAVRWARVGVVVTFFVHGLLFASWTAHIPQVKAHLHLDNATLGVALLGAPVGSVSAMLAAAALIPRFGSRRVVQVCLLGYGISGPFVGLTGSTAALFAALFVWGAFMGTLDIAMNTQAIAVEGARDRAIMNTTHAFWSLGAFAGAGLGAVCVAVGISLSWQLLVAGSVAIVVAEWLTLRMLLDAADPAAAERPASAPAARPRWPHRLSSAVLLLGAITFASMLCEGAAADWSSVYLHDSVHASAAISGLGYAAFALAMVGARLSGDRLIERFEARRVLPALALVAAVVFAIALAVGAVPITLFGFFALGAGLGAVVPTTFSAAGRLPDLHPGVAVAAVSGMGWAGFVLGPPLIGQLAGLSTLRAALAVIPVLAAFVAVASNRVAALRRAA